MRNFLAAIVVLLVAVLAWTAPAKPTPQLKVKGFKPAHGRTFVKLTQRIEVKFSRRVDPATVTPQTVALNKLSGEPVAVGYATSANGRVVFLTPTARLAGSTDYRVVVKPGVLSIDGRPLARERHANFFTQSNPDALRLVRPDQFEALALTMAEGRGAHSATLMVGGNVLLAGGMTDYTSYAVSGDVFEPGSKRFRPSGGQLTERRAYHPATQFGTGVMLVGGSGANGALSSTEVYFPQGFQFVPGPALTEQRDFVSACTLKDGRVLVVGGLHYVGTAALYSDTAEIYDPASGAFRVTHGAPVKRRAGHSATVLPDGRVLIVGGQSGSASPAAEIFDPATETFTLTASPPSYHRKLHAATLLDPLGRVLLVDGGSALLELYDPAADAFFPAGGASSVNRTGAVANLLPDGDVLIAGGLEDRGGQGLALDSFDLYMPQGAEHGAVFRPSVVFAEARYGHTGTSLTDGRVLYAGGFGQATSASLDTGVLFTPDVLAQ